MTGVMSAPRPGHTGAAARKPRAGTALVMGAGVLWGTTGTSQALSPYAGSPLGLGATRVGVAGLLLAVVAVILHGRSTLILLLPRGARRYLLLGAVGMAGYQAFFFTATKLTGVAVGTLTAIGAAPLIAGGIAAATGRRPTRRWLAATAVAVAGLALLVGPGAGTVDPAGVAAGLAAGAGYALYTWCSRQLLDAGVPPVPLLAGLFLGGAALVLPFAGRGAGQWLADPGGLAVVGYLAVAATVLPYAMWIRGMATTAPAVATTLTLTEPLTAAALGVLVLHEPVTVTLAAGAALLGVGLVMTVTGGRGSLVADGPEQGSDLGVGQMPEPAGLHVAEPDRADGGTDQP
jgi:DME family drug/metabolite transporter